MPHTDRMVAEKVLGELKARGMTRIGLLSENVGFGKSGRDQTLQVAARLGLEILADETYAPKDADVTPQLTRIKATPGVQALFIFGTGAGPAVAIRNVRQIALTVPVYLTHGVASKDFLRLVGTAADGMRLPAAGLAVAEQLADRDAQKAMVLDYKATYETAFGEEVSQFGGHALDALNIAIAAWRRAGSTDKARFRDEVERTAGYVGTGGLVTYSATDHLGLGLDSFHMVEVREGAFALSDE
jgi:branched-chain amino acid transport system substrate-binding protein